MATARKVLQGPATISVIGDSTGNDENEWVALWAAALGKDHRVTLQRWLEGRYRPSPLLYGANGHRITIWNAGEPGGDASWPVKRMAILQPEKPDLVLLSFGHNNTADDLPAQLEQLHRELPKGVATVLILQNPGRGDHAATQAATLYSAKLWAQSREVPTIDVTAAFTDPSDQMSDDYHPNEVGSRVWAEAVEKALSP